MNFFKISQKKLGAIISYITLATQTVSTILVTPFFINSLGKGEYGLYELIGSTVSYLSILGLGLSSSYIRFFSQYETNNNKKGIASLNGLFLTLFLIMSTICLILGGLLVYKIRWVFGAGISADDYPKAQAMMIILVLEMALRFPSSIFTSDAAAHERFIFQKSLMLAETILVPLLRVLFVISGYQSVGLAAASLCVALTEFIINAFYNFRKLNIQFNFAHIDKMLFKEIAVFTFFIFLNQLYDLLGGSKVDVFIIGRFRGPEEITVYSVADKFVKIFYSISNPIAAVFVPQINRLVSFGNKMTDINRIFLKVCKIQLAIQTFILSGFFIFGQEFIRVWMGEGYDTSYWIAFIIMVADVVALSQHIGIEIQRAMNNHKIRSCVLMITNLGNIALTIPLTIKMGAIGAAYGTAVCEVLGTVFFMNWYYKKYLKLDIVGYWKNGLKVLAFVIPLTVITFYVKTMIAGTFKEIILLILAYSFIYAIGIMFFTFNKEERNNLLKRN